MTGNPYPLVYSTLESDMNIELEEVVQDVSDDALELAAGSAQGGQRTLLINDCQTTDSSKNRC